MVNKVLFIGNGINNLNNQSSWKAILEELRKKVKKNTDAEDLINHFPLVFENLLNFGLLHNNLVKENELKQIVANGLSGLETNLIHERIKSLSPKNIITTNYDFLLEEGFSIENTSVVQESKFSIFRRYTTKESGRNIWHVHGDAKNPETITLGYEHYCGQLQAMRNYVVSGTHYKGFSKVGIIKRIEQLTDQSDSWIDMFFKDEIHIIGLCLDFIEIDLWWLMAYRAKLINQAKKIIRNRIYYYIPYEFCCTSKGKIELLENMGIVVREINKTGFEYYDHVLNYIERKFSISELLKP